MSHQAFNPAFAGDVPYVVPHVTMDGTDRRVFMIGNIIGGHWEDVQLDEVTLPNFRLRLGRPNL